MKLEFSSYKIFKSELFEDIYRFSHSFFCNKTNEELKNYMLCISIFVEILNLRHEKNIDVEKLWFEIY